MRKIKPPARRPGSYNGRVAILTSLLLLAAGQAKEERFRLENGLEAVLKRAETHDAVATAVAYRAGTLDDPAGRVGLAHLLEHLVFRGATPSFPAGEAERQLQAAGATGVPHQDANAETTHDFTYFYSILPSAKLDLALQVEAERMGSCVFMQELLDAERTKALGEIGFVAKNPAAQGWSRLMDLAYARLGYRHPKAGLEADVRAVTLEEAAAHYRKYYGPQNAVLVIYGKIDLAGARALVEKRFAKIPRGPVLERRSDPEPEPVAARREVIDAEGPPARILMAWRSAPHGSRDKAALLIAIYQMIVRAGLEITKVSPQNAIYDDPWAREESVVFWGSFQTTAPDLAAAEKAILAVVEGVRESLIDPESFALRKQQILMELSGDDLQALTWTARDRAQYLQQLAQLAINRLRREVYAGDRAESLARHLKEITPSEVRDAARKYLAPGRSNTLVVRPR